MTTDMDWRERSPRSAMGMVRQYCLSDRSRYRQSASSCRAAKARSPSAVRRTRGGLRPSPCSPPGRIATIKISTVSTIAGVSRTTQSVIDIRCSRFSLVHRSPTAIPEGNHPGGLATCLVREGFGRASWSGGSQGSTLAAVALTEWLSAVATLLAAVAAGLSWWAAKRSATAAERSATAAETLNGLESARRDEELAPEFRLEAHLAPGYEEIAGLDLRLVGGRLDSVGDVTLEILDEVGQDYRLGGPPPGVNLAEFERTVWGPWEFSTGASAQVVDNRRTRPRTFGWVNGQDWDHLALTRTRPPSWMEGDDRVESWRRQRVGPVRILITAHAPGTNATWHQLHEVTVRPHQSSPES